MVIATIVMFIWLYGSRLHTKLPAFVARMPEAARRFLAFALVLALAILPSDFYLTRTWTTYLDTVLTTVRTRDGVIAFEIRRWPSIPTICWSKPGSCPARAWRCAPSMATA